MQITNYLVNRFSLKKESYSIDEKNLSKDSVLVKVMNFGICGSDLLNIEVNHPKIISIGHEWVGEVIMSNSSNLFKGDYVTSSPFLGCGKCKFCNLGLDNFCNQASIFGHNHSSASQNFMVFKDADLIKIPNELRKYGIIIEPLGFCYYIRDLLFKELDSEKSILLFGVGTIGLILGVLLKESNVGFDFIEKNMFRRNIALNQGFVESNYIKENKKYDIVIDCAGGLNKSIGIWNSIHEYVEKNAVAFLIGKYNGVNKNLTPFYKTNIKACFIRGMPSKYLREILIKESDLINRIYEIIVTKELLVSDLLEGINEGFQQAKHFRIKVNHEH